MTDNLKELIVILERFFCNMLYHSQWLILCSNFYRCTVNLIFVFTIPKGLQYILKVKDHISQTQLSLIEFIQNYNNRATCFDL